MHSSVYYRVKGTISAWSKLWSTVEIQALYSQSGVPQAAKKWRSKFIDPGRSCAFSLVPRHFTPVRPRALLPDPPFPPIFPTGAGGGSGDETRCLHGV